MTESAATVPSCQNWWEGEFGVSEYYRQSKEKPRGALPFDRLEMQLSVSPCTVNLLSKAEETVGGLGRINSLAPA